MTSSSSSSTHRDGAPEAGESGGEPASRALVKAHRALAWMSESVRRSLAHAERVPGHGQRALRARYTDLAGRVARSAAALNAASERKSQPLRWFETVALLATVYRLEKELNDANEERDRLMCQQKEQPTADNRTACRIL